MYPPIIKISNNRQELPPIIKVNNKVYKVVK